MSNKTIVHAIESLQLSVEQQRDFHDDATQLALTQSEILFEIKDVLDDIATGIRVIAFGQARANLIERRRQKLLDLKSKDDADKSPIATSGPEKGEKPSGGAPTFFDTILEGLKKALLGGALLGAFLLIKDNWDLITETFQKMVPYIIDFGKKVWEIGSVVLPVIIDNFKEIAVGMLALWSAIKIAQFIKWAITAAQLVKAAAIAMAASTASFAAGLWSAVTFIGSSLIALAPFVAAGAALALLFVALKEGVDDALAVFNETGSIWAAFQAGAATLVGNIIGLPLEYLTKAAGWLAEKFGVNPEWLSDLADKDWVNDIAKGYTSLQDSALTLLGGDLTKDLMDADAINAARDERVAKRKESGVREEGGGVLSSIGSTIGNLFSGGEGVSVAKIEEPKAEGAFANLLGGVAESTAAMTAPIMPTFVNAPSSTVNNSSNNQAVLMSTPKATDNYDRSRLRLLY